MVKNKIPAQRISSVMVTHVPMLGNVNTMGDLA